MNDVINCGAANTTARDEMISRLVMILFGVLLCLPGIYLLWVVCNFVYVAYFSASGALSVEQIENCFFRVGGHSFGPYHMHWVLLGMTLGGFVFVGLGICCMFYKGCSKCAANR